MPCKYAWSSSAFGIQHTQWESAARLIWRDTWREIYLRGVHWLLRTNLILWKSYCTVDVSNLPVHNFHGEKIYATVSHPGLSHDSKLASLSDLIFPRSIDDVTSSSFALLGDSAFVIRNINGKIILERKNTETSYIPNNCTGHGWSYSSESYVYWDTKGWVGDSSVKINIWNALDPTHSKRQTVVSFYAGLFTSAESANKKVWFESNQTFLCKPQKLSFSHGFSS